MNIPKINLSDFGYCLNCKRTDTTNGKKFYFSQLCFHQLCESCYKMIFAKPDAKLDCLCKKRLEKTDFFSEQPDEKFYQNDAKIRSWIFNNYSFKSLENFSSQEEYDNYLEEMEVLIEQNNGRDFSDNDFINLLKAQDNYGKNYQDQEGRTKNISARMEEMNRLLKLDKEYEPGRIYNTRFVESQDKENLMENKEMNTQNYRDKNVINYNIPQLKMPIFRDNMVVDVERNIEKKIKAGGYCHQQVFRDFALYAKEGLITY